jgi:hypothetical protein
MSSAASAARTPLARAARRLAALAALALLATGCATGPKLYANQDPGANFAGYRTFAFAEPLDTDRPQYSSVLSGYLKAAATRELEARGYKAATGDADLLVNFHVETKEKIQTTSTPTGPTMGMGYGYYGYRGMNYGVWSGYETEVRQYTEGTLNIDLIDRERKRLVWEGIAVGRINDKVRENLGAAVDEVVGLVFQKYPHRAAP